MYGRRAASVSGKKDVSDSVFELKNGGIDVTTTAGNGRNSGSEGL